MDTVAFIRYHTRLILEKSEGEPTGKYTTRRGLGAGRISAKAREQLGLAASQPDELLKRLNMGNYRKKGGSRVEEIFNFLNDAVSKSQLGIAFDRPEKSGTKIIVPLVVIGENSTAVTKTQAPRYIEASLLAGGLLDLIDFNTERDRVQVCGTGKGDEEKFAVIVTYRG